MPLMLPKSLDRYIGYIGEIRIKAPFLFIIGTIEAIIGQKCRVIKGVNNFSKNYQDIL